MFALNNVIQGISKCGHIPYMGYHMVHLWAPINLKRWIFASHYIFIHTGLYMSFLLNMPKSWAMMFSDNLFKNVDFIILVKF